MTGSSSGACTVERARPARTMPLSLPRNWAWALAGNSTYLACQWGCLVAVTKLGSVEVVGRFSLASAVTAPIVCLAALQLRFVLATDAKREYSFAEYLILNLITTALGLSVIAAVALLGGYSADVWPLILVIGLTKSLEALSDLTYGLMQQHERLDWVSRSQMLRGVLAVIALSIGVAASGILAGAIAMAIVWMLVLLIHDLWGGAARIVGRRAILSLLGMALIRGMDRTTAARLKSLVWLAMPLGFVAMLNVLNASLPRYFIASYAGERELGLFAGCVALLGSFFLVQTAIGQASLPRLSQAFARGDRSAFLRISRFVMGFSLINGLLAVAVAYGCGEPLLHLVYTSEYAQQGPLFLWLAIAAAAQCQGHSLIFLLNATRHYRAMAGVALAVGASTLLFCSAWVPAAGPLGAAWAIGASSVVATTLSLVLLKRRLAVPNTPETETPLFCQTAASRT